MNSKKIYELPDVTIQKFTYTDALLSSGGFLTSSLGGSDEYDNKASIRSIFKGGDD